jgi:hypothetical protein
VSSNSLNLALASWADQTFIVGILLTVYLTGLMDLCRCRSQRRLSAAVGRFGAGIPS